MRLFRSREEVDSWCARSGRPVGAIVGLSVVFVVPWLASFMGMTLPAKVHVGSIFLSLAVAISVGPSSGSGAALTSPRMLTLAAHVGAVTTIAYFAIRRSTSIASRRSSPMAFQSL